MNEQLQAELAKLVGMLNEGAEKVAEFGAEQIPIVLQQLLLWHSIHSLLGFVIGIAVAFTGYKLIGVANQKAIEAEKDHADGKSWTRFSPKSGLTSIRYDTVTGFERLIIPSSLILIGFVISARSMTWLKIWIAPNLYLLEYAAGLVK